MTTDDARQRRERCLACFRPLADCHCSTIPLIDNQVEVLILQHRRERFHPFNTARLAHQGLRNSTLLVDHVPQLAARLELRPGAGLLFPSRDARLLSSLAPHERPAQLVVVDGTWHQAKTLVRDIPALATIPRFRLEPAAPSDYRIRREPNAQALSTVEAVVAALRDLEPETRGCDELLAAFRLMVDRHLAHPKVDEARRRLARPTRTWKNVPLALLGSLDGLVLAYAEIAPVPRGVRRIASSPLVVAAQRWESGETFFRTVRSSSPPDATLLAHLDLTAAEFTGAAPLEEVAQAWRAWLRPGDQTIVYSPGTGRQIDELSSRIDASIVLKSVDFHAERRYPSLDDLVAGENLPLEAPATPGRAGRRLANLAAVARHLRLRGLARESNSRE